MCGIGVLAHVPQLPPVHEFTGQVTIFKLRLSIELEQPLTSVRTTL